MPVRVVRLSSRNPLVGAALLVVLVALILVVALLGLTVLAGLAALGAVGLIARRLLGSRRRPAPALASLDPSREVFAPPEPASPNRLPPGAG